MKVCKECSAGWGCTHRPMPWWLLQINNFANWLLSLADTYMDNKYLK